jgi:molecular chaperone GrpE
LDQKPEEGAFFAQLKELENRVKVEEEKTTEFRNLAQRVQAEFENFAKRTEKEKNAFKLASNAGLLREFLPFLDSLDSAIESARKHESHKNSVQGLELLRKQFVSVLEKNGVKKIEALGKKFDHNLHEVLMHESRKDIEDEIVTGELLAGYTLNGFVLRESRVKINKLDNDKLNNEKKENVNETEE